VPIGNGLRGDTFWIVTEHGYHADYVRNIRADPRVRVKVGRTWFEGTAHILDEDGNEVSGEQGVLALRRPWPGMLRTLYKDQERFKETYFSKWDEKTYFVGDAARKDEDGYFWIIGRVDDVINVSGHRLSTAEVESESRRRPKLLQPRPTTDTSRDPIRRVSIGYPSLVTAVDSSL
jgi:deazaflavin-dependent oxidoreductase (nitroreductase family)